MIWVVGTGRCGTGSAAEYFDTYPEPGRRMPTAYLPSLYEGLIERGEKVIVDRHRPVPLLIELYKFDPDMFIVWQIRNPFDCLASFALMHMPTTVEFYREVNEGIYNAIIKLQCPYAVVEPSDFEYWAHWNPERKYTFTRAEAIHIFDITWPIWAKAMELKRESWELPIGGKHVTNIPGAYTRRSP